VGEGAPRGNREAVVASKGSGNGKLWLIIGGGVAALFLLIAAALVLMKMGGPKPSETADNARVAAEKKEIDSLVKELTKAGERIENAEKIVRNSNFDDPVLKGLTNQIQVFQKGLQSLGKDKRTSEDSRKELETFISNTENFQPLKFPKGTLCESLWESVSLIRKVHDEDPASRTEKSAGGLLDDLKIALESVKWLKEEEIDQIYLTLWELEYQKLVDSFVDGAGNKNLKTLKGFMDIREKAVVSDSTIEEIHGRLGEDKLNKYAAKVNAENPKLLKKFLLPAPMAEDKDKIAATSPNKDEPKPGNNPSVKAPKLEDEEWCYADFKPEGEAFSIKIPGSAILSQISEAKDHQNVEFSFGDEEIIKVGASNNSLKTIKFENNQIIIKRAFNNIPIPSPLKIIHQGNEVVIYFNKWPEMPKDKKPELSGRFEQVPSEAGRPASYRLLLDGLNLTELERLSSNTIPVASLVWNLSGVGNVVPREISKGHKTLVIEGLKPEGDEVEPPSDKISNAFQEAVKVTNQQAKEKIAKEKKDLKGLQKLTEDEINEIHEEAWLEHGWNHLKKEDSKSLEWLKKRFKSEHGLELSKISRIGGKDRDKNDTLALEIMENPTEKRFYPSLDSIPNVTVGVKVGNDTYAYGQKFKITLEKNK